MLCHGLMAFMLNALQRFTIKSANLKVIRAGTTTWTRTVTVHTS